MKRMDYFTKWQIVRPISFCFNLYNAMKYIVAFYNRWTFLCILPVLAAGFINPFKNARTSDVLLR